VELQFERERLVGDDAVEEEAHSVGGGEAEFGEHGIGLALQIFVEADVEHGRGHGRNSLIAIAGPIIRADHREVKAYRLGDVIGGRPCGRC
jgi:hypothetical protein